MFITKECDYAIRIVRELADGQRKPVLGICNKESVPHPYAYKILKKLEKAGIVKSYRGPRGGYALVKDADTLTLYDVLISLEEDLSLTECLKSGFDCERNNPEQPCQIHYELCRVQRLMFEALRDKYIGQILREKNPVEQVQAGHKFESSID